jgi:hypothetical protein
MLAQHNRRTRIIRGYGPVATTVPPEAIAVEKIIAAFIMVDSGLAGPFHTVILDKQTWNKRFSAGSGGILPEHGIVSPRTLCFEKEEY